MEIREIFRTMHFIIAFLILVIIMFMSPDIETNKLIVVSTAGIYNLVAGYSGE
jgi:hypothetical protein